jgi:hypothetical protein
MKTFPALIIADALEAIGEDADALLDQSRGGPHRPGFAIETDRDFTIVVVEIANHIVQQDNQGYTNHGYLMGQLVDMVDEVRKAPGMYIFPGWTLRYED